MALLLEIFGYCEEYRLKRPALHPAQKRPCLKLSWGLIDYSSFRDGPKDGPQMRNCASGNPEIPGSMLRIARNDNSRRAADIGFAAANHAFRCGLGVGLRGGRANAVFEIGQAGGLAAAEP
jgi:hypothetical protein